MGSEWYIYDDRGVPVLSSPHEFSKWVREDVGRKILKQETVGDKLVSTVFLGLDHRFGDGQPLVFETMVFPKDSYLDDYCERYETRDRALAGHARVVERLKSGQPL